MKKSTTIFFMLILMAPVLLCAQAKEKMDKHEQDIYALINNYSLAREKKDTSLLKTILTSDVDQLVSNGEWRTGVGESVQGMLRSSSANPGTRTLTVEKIRFLDPNNAIADARYDIKNSDGSTRKMWSTFIVVQKKGSWKISAIRNMLPSGGN